MEVDESDFYLYEKSNIGKHWMRSFMTHEKGPARAKLSLLWVICERILPSCAFLHARENPVYGQFQVKTSKKCWAYFHATSNNYNKKIQPGDETLGLIMVKMDVNIHLSISIKWNNVSKTHINVN